MATKSKKGKASIRAAAARNRANKAANDKKKKSSSKSSNSKAPSVNYTFDSRRETTAQYNARIKREREAVASYNAKNQKSEATNTTTTTNMSNNTAPTVNYTFDSRKETTAQYNARIERERQAVRDYNAKNEMKKEEKQKEEEPGDTPGLETQKTLSLKELQSSPEYKALSKDQRSAVESVFLAIGENNAESAKRLVSAFQAAEKLADPFFKQQIRLAKDAVERGFVEVDRELAFSEEQARRRLEDLRVDIQEQGEFLTMEEQNDLKAIEREYKNVLDTTRNNLAAAGMSSSSVRAEKEQIIEETTGDLREGTRRKFGFQRGQLEDQLSRGQRDTTSEVARLREVAKQTKTSLFRKGEEELGTANLPALNFDVKPLGNVSGSINQQRNEDIIGAVKNLIF